MNILGFYTTLYGFLCCDWLPNRALSPLRYLVRKLANYHLSNWLQKDRILKQKYEKGLIVSLTSFPARIDNVWKVVESIKCQSILPEKIILWLSKEQFTNDSYIPENLRLMQSKWFEIRFVEGDIRSHKKYMYVCQTFPNNLIFLIDDDIYYSPKIIENSLKRYWTNPHSVICNYGCQIAFDDKGRHLPYKYWQSINKDNKNVFFGSGGGTLFCPKDLYKDLTNLDRALKLTPTGDDIWLNAMARLARIKVIPSYNKLLLPVLNQDDIKLTDINNGTAQNDVQIEAVEQFYGRCFDKIFN